MSLADLNAKITGKKVGQGSRARVTKPIVPANSDKLAKSNRILRSLVDAIDDDDVSEVLAVWRRAMKATRKYWQDPKKGEKRGRWVAEPDFRTQLEASKLVAAYKEGLPVQRQVNLNIGHEELADVLAKAKSSPAALEALKLLGAGTLIDSQP